MILAVSYDQDGQIFQHFGKTENFKLYAIEDGKVLKSVIVSSNGQGHGALAQILAGYDVDAIICGGIGMGAVNALEMMGIICYAGVSGDADAAVEAFLKGELAYSADASCDHHHDHDCDHKEEECCH